MPTTPKGLPYPLSSDPPNVPLYIQQLAEAMDQFIPVTKRLAAAYSHPVNNTTLADVTGLAISLTPGTWSLEYHLALSTTTPAPGDAKTAFTFSGTATVSQQYVQGNSTATADVGNSANMRSTVHNIGTAVSHGADGVTASYVRIHLTLVVTVAGTLQLQFAQNTANATASGLSTATHVVYGRTA